MSHTPVARTSSTTTAATAGSVQSAPPFETGPDGWPCEAEAVGAGVAAAAISAVPLGDADATVGVGEGVAVGARVAVGLAVGVGLGAGVFLGAAVGAGVFM